MLDQPVNQQASFTLWSNCEWRKINSQTLKLPSGKILKGNDRKIFETKKIKLDVLKSKRLLD